MSQLPGVSDDYKEEYRIWFRGFLSPTQGTIASNFLVSTLLLTLWHFLGGDPSSFASTLGGCLLPMIVYLKQLLMQWQQARSLVQYPDAVRGNSDWSPWLYQQQQAFEVILCGALALLLFCLVKGFFLFGGGIGCLLIGIWGWFAAEKLRHESYTQATAPESY